MMQSALAIGYLEYQICKDGHLCGIVTLSKALQKSIITRDLLVYYSPWFLNK